MTVPVNSELKPCQCGRVALLRTISINEQGKWVKFTRCDDCWVIVTQHVPALLEVVNT